MLTDAKLSAGQRLTQLRKSKGLTTAELADLMTQAGAKVSRAAISNWERGSNGIVSNKLPVLCLLYTSPSPRDLSTSRMPSSA